MRLKNLFKLASNTAVIGVDISRTAIKLVELDYHASRYKVLNHAFIKLPAGIHNVAENNPLLIELLQACLQKVPFKTRRAVTALSSTAIMTKIIQLDKSLSNTEIYQHFLLQQEYYLGCNSDFCWDFKLVDAAQKNLQQQSIALIAARRDDVNGYASLLKDSGFKAIAIETQVSALERVSQFLELKNNTLIVYVAEEWFLCGVIKDDHLQFCHDKNFSDNHLESVQRSQEIFQEIQWFLNTQEDSNVQHIALLAEDASCMQPLLQQKINVPISIVNPFLKIECDASVAIAENLSRYALALGMAMWDFA